MHRYVFALVGGKDLPGNISSGVDWYSPDRHQRARASAGSVFCSAEIRGADGTRKTRK